MQHRKLFRAGLLAAALGAGGFASQVDAATVSNPYSGAPGDRANFSGFALQLTAGTFPTSVDPAGALEGVDAVFLDAITFTAPDNPDGATGSSANPQVGMGPGLLTSLATPVYVDIYTTRGTGLAFSDYVGSSDTSVIWNDGGENVMEDEESYTFDFTGITLDKDTPYWLVFSETGTEGDVANFRTRVNTSATAAGVDYLDSDVQVVNQLGTTFDWGVEYTAAVTAVPEPASLSLLGVGGLALLGRRRHI